MGKGSGLILFLIFALGTIPVSISFFRDYQVFTHGIIVEATITEVRGNLLKFKYNDVNYEKTLGKHGSRNFHEGDKVVLRHLKVYEHNFLFQNENPLYTGSILLTMLLLGCLGSLYYVFKK